ncbi:MAG: hypothetical protein WBA22_16665 [Candidatus Methanofastidiosia archaeon]
MDRENYSQKELMQMVYEGKFRAIYTGKLRDELMLEHFNPPGEIPGKNTDGEFWRKMWTYGVWLPVCYKLSDRVKIKFCTCNNRDRGSLFNKFLDFKSKSDVRIRMFPIGGFSLNMITGINVKDDSEAYFTMDELKYLTDEFYDDVMVSIHNDGHKISEEMTIRGLFEYFADNVRRKFIYDLTKSESSKMAMYSIIDVVKCKGPWNADEIRKLCEIDIKCGKNLEVLRKNHKIGNYFKGDRKHCEIDFAGPKCALICTRSDKPSELNRWTDEFCDMVEFVFLRKEMIRDYIYFTDQCVRRISHHREDLWGEIEDAVRRIFRKENFWIDQRFITHLEKLSRVEDGFLPGFHRDNVLLRIVRESGYQNDLKELEKKLLEAKTEIERYNLELSKAISHAVDVMVKMIKLYSKIKGW